MLILAFDTSTNTGGVALCDDDQLLAQKTWDREGSHGELLLPAIEACLIEARKRPRDIDSLAIGHGPGSFTGVRVAVNAARALGSSLEKLIYVFDTTEIIAHAIPVSATPLAVLLNAHKNLVFASTFVAENGVWTRQMRLNAYSFGELEHEMTTEHFCVGDAFTEFSQIWPPGLISKLRRDPSFNDDPSPVAIAALAVRSSRPPLVWKDVQALYIRASGAEEKKRETISS